MVCSDVPSLVRYVFWVYSFVAQKNTTQPQNKHVNTGVQCFFRIMFTIIPLRLAICLALPVPSQDFFLLALFSLLL